MNQETFKTPIYIDSLNSGRIHCHEQCNFGTWKAIGNLKNFCNREIMSALNFQQKYRLKQICKYYYKQIIPEKSTAIGDSLIVNYRFYFHVHLWYFLDHVSTYRNVLLSSKIVMIYFFQFPDIADKWRKIAPQFEER